MTSSAYADSRWGFGAHAHDTRTPLSFGVLYPRNDVITVLDDKGWTEQGARALVDADIPGEQIDVLSGRAFAARIAVAKHQRGFFNRIGARLSRLFSDAEYVRSLLDEARQNHALLTIHAADGALAARVPAVLRAHAAHGVRYYGRGAIEDLV